MRRTVLFVSAVAVVVASAAMPSAGVGASARVSGVILYSRSRSIGGVPGIYVVRPASGAARPLHGRFFHGNHAALSPNGSKLVFEQWHLLEDDRSARFGWDLIISAADGSGARVLVPWSDRLPFPADPAWSRDGRFIHFVNSGPNDFPRSFVVRATGGRARVSKPPPKAVPAPTGSREAIRLDRGIAVRDRSTGSVKIVAHACRPFYNDPNVGRPTWSPDGRWLAYVDCLRSDRQGYAGFKRGVIAIVRADGGSTPVIVAHGFSLTAPSWRGDT